MFGRYISKLRIERGYESQRQLAIDAGVSPSTVLRIEDGTQRATPDTLRKLAPHLGASYKTLLEKAGYSEGGEGIDPEQLIPKGAPDDERIKALLRSAEDLTDKEKDILFEEVANYLEYQKQKIRRTRNGGANKQ